MQNIALFCFQPKFFPYSTVALLTPNLFGFQSVTECEISFIKTQPDFAWVIERNKNVVDLGKTLSSMYFI